MPTIGGRSQACSRSARAVDAGTRTGPSHRYLFDAFTVLGVHASAHHGATPRFSTDALDRPLAASGRGRAHSGVSSDLTPLPATPLPTPSLPPPKLTL